MAIPTNLRVPSAYFEVNSTTLARSTAENQRIMVIGQRTSAGTVAALTPTQITSYAQAVDAFGAGSMLASMFKVLFDNNSDIEKWAIGISDNGAGVAATGSVTVTASSVEAGTISLYVGGKRIPVAVSDADTDTEIAAAIVAAINADTELPVTAAVDGSDDAKANITFKHKGTVGNSFDIRTNFSGVSAGEVLPTGVSLVTVQLTGGTTDPLLTSAWAVMPDEIFHYIVIPYTDTTNLDAADTEMQSRWSATRMLDGHIFASTRGSVSTVGTFGNARNNEHMSVLDGINNSPTPPMLWAAAAAGRVASEASIDPATPFNGLELIGILAPPQANRRTQSERNSLLFDGIATTYVGQDGKVYLERLITTYQTSSVGLPDGTWLDANTPFTLSRIKQEHRNHFSNRFPRAKLADDGATTIAGSNVITPNGIKAEFVAKAQEHQAKGWIENIAEFISSIVVARDESDPTRVNVVMYPDLVNQLHVVGVSIQFSV